MIVLQVNPFSFCLMASFIILSLFSQEKLIAALAYYMPIKNLTFLPIVSTMMPS
jgi:hypothetical protein